VATASLTYLLGLLIPRATRPLLERHPRLLGGLPEEVARQRLGSDSRPDKVMRIRRRDIVLLLMLGLLVHFLLPQVGEVRTALHDLFHANPVGVLGSVLASVATFLFSALALRFSAGNKIPLRPTIAVQFATALGNLTPGSVGAIALSIRYLQKQGLSATMAATAVAIARVAGVVSVILLLPVLLPFAHKPSGHLPTATKSLTVLLVVLGALLLVAAALAVPKLRTRSRQNLRQAADTLRAVTERGRALRLVSVSLALTVAYGACLYLALLAVGLPAHLSLMAQVLLVSIAGEGVASAAPTPGGLGATEAALVSGLLIYGIPTETAIAGVLIYRVASFWLPLVPGVFALQALRRRHRI
jgi:undecaprenyl-diphosphatase